MSVVARTVPSGPVSCIIAARLLVSSEDTVHIMAPFLPIASSLVATVRSTERAAGRGEGGEGEIVHVCAQLLVRLCLFQELYI